MCSSFHLQHVDQCGVYTRSTCQLSTNTIPTMRKDTFSEQVGRRRQGPNGGSKVSITAPPPPCVGSPSWPCLLALAHPVPRPDPPIPCRLHPPTCLTCSPKIDHLDVREAGGSSEPLGPVFLAELVISCKYCVSLQKRGW